MAPAQAATLAAARAPTAARTPLTAPPEDRPPNSGTDPVRDVIDNVVTLPTPLTGRDQGGGDGPADDEYALPPGFPVTPLGVSVEVDGLYCHYIDAAGRLRSLRDKDHTRLHLFGLVGKDIHLLKKHWPRMTELAESTGTGSTKKKTGKFIVTGWKPEECAAALMAAAARAGDFEIAEAERKAGAWRDEDGALIMHFGDRVLVGREWREPGRIGDYVYSRCPTLPPPADLICLGGAKGPAAELLAMLRSWNWEKPELIPHLVLGWIGAAMIGGALDWRPTLWLTGDFGTGKSTLIDKLLRRLFGRTLLSVADATAAGLAQHQRRSTTPIALDELEASEDGKARQAIIELARVAVSGSRRIRGSSAQQAQESGLGFCALFSAILMPPLAPQDLSRSTVAEMRELIGNTPPAMPAAKMRAMGAALMRRMIDQYPRLDRAIETYKTAMIKAGHVARGADQYGTLLGCAEVLLYDRERVPDDELTKWQTRLAAKTLAADGDELHDQDHCIRHLLSFVINANRNDRCTLGQKINKALSGDELMTASNDLLATYGLKIHTERQKDAAPAHFLWVGSNHAGLAEIFKGTHWAQRAGQSTVYTQSLRRLPLATRPASPVRLGGQTMRITSLPLCGGDSILSGDTEE